MRKRKEPSIPLGQVSSKAKLRRGRGSFEILYVNEE
jgi:hypothetical protein